MKTIRTLNTFRIIQYSIFIFYVVMYIVSYGIKFADNFEFQNYPYFIYVYYSYYLSEVINVTCWIGFIFHLQLYSKKDEITDEKINRVKCVERVLLVINIIIFVFFIIWMVSLHIITLVNLSDCEPWHPFYEFKEWKNQWYDIAYVFKGLFHLLLVLGGILILIKISTGIILLVKMKKNLNFFYQQKYIHIILTIIVSTLVTLWRCFYSLFIDYYDVKYNYAARKYKEGKHMPVEITVWLIDLLLPIAVMMYNIKNINYEKYIKKMLKGCMVQMHHSDASIFLVKQNLLNVSEK